MITLTIPADALNKTRVLALRLLVQQFPGSEEIMLRLPPPADCEGCEEKLLRLGPKVDGSPEFLLAAMGLLDR